MKKTIKIVCKGLILFVCCLVFSNISLNSLAGEIQEDFPILKGPYLGQKTPGETPELFAPGIVSTCVQHSSAYFSRDGKEVVFSRMFPRPSVILYMQEEKGRWTSPQVVAEGLTPFLTADGQRIFFSTSSLWVMDKTLQDWSKARKLSSVVNFQKRQDVPSVSADGTLYFCSMFGNQDGIYRAKGDNGYFIEREKLEYGINTGKIDGYPYIAPDESFLLFGSFRPGSIGMSDLYVSFQREDGTWTQPKNLGRNINSEAIEGFPFVSADGKYLFYMSNRISRLNSYKIPDGPGNVYWVKADFLDRMRKKELGK